ncbi:TaqI-like C-terminal specificity domain-containing protein [Flavobacterium magnum]|uniref:TaqI-like C-terminal specificity domain-containing protein n=1 Tax=Flavobacterium magnum TaxID=2162713 RepID=UPI0015E7AB5C
MRTPKMFNDKKIIIRKTGDSLICAVDELSYCFDTLAHGIYQKNKNYSLEFLTAILNSTPATIFYRLLHDIKGKVFAKISLDNLSSFPIPNCDTSQRNEIEGTSIKLSALSKELNDENLKFQRSLQRKFELDSLPKTLQNWYLLNYSKFIGELGKLKIKLTLSQEAEWEDYFIAESNKVRAIRSEIDGINKSLNKSIYKMYGITNDEIEIIDK